VTKNAVYPSTRRIALTILLGLAPASVFAQQSGPFRLEESTIADIQNAIKTGQVTCQGIVQAYINRAKAYNGMCTALVTKDGKPIPAAMGPVRAGSPVRYPTQTVPVSSVLPNYDKYLGPPMELGRMESTVSDPSVQSQFGMRVGIPNAGQVNALETINIRGERSVTCKGDFDKAPSAGPLPAGAPKVCEEFRKQPDALERAAELDTRYGTNPDLATYPLYCAVMSLKNWYDAKDMRSTGGNDINYAMDVPREDSPDIADLREKGAIIYAIATAKATGVGGGGGGGGGGNANAASVLLDGNMGYGVWGGQTCNPYDTERVPRGTSNGSGTSVAANLVSCSICEQTSASCKGPASRNNVVNLLTTKGILMDGGPGHSNPGDRAGIHCRTVGDAVKVLDAIKGFDAKDIFSALPPGIIPKEPYASFLADASQKSLQGMRIAIVREFMVKHTANDVAISDHLDKEIKTVLRDKLGAELVESVDPLYDDDPAVPNMKYTFQQAFKEILPKVVPEFFLRTTNSGELLFAVPGWDVRTVEYMVALATGKAPLSDKLNLRSITGGTSIAGGGVAMAEYLINRGDERVKDQESLRANSKSERLVVPGGSTGASNSGEGRVAQNSISYLKMQTVMRMVIQKVMSENKIDAFVNPEQTTPPYKLGGPGEPEVNNRPTISCCTGFTALIGAPEIDVPAGYSQIVYEPQYVLSPDKKQYLEVTGTVKSMLPNPMPISLMFWAGPGNEPWLIKAASAYEAATRHRVPPKGFGKVPGEP